MSELNRYATSANGALQNASGYFPEGQAPSTVNDAARTFMADVRRQHQAWNAEKTATYAAGTYSVTYDREVTSGEIAGIWTFIADSANASASAKLSINGLTAIDMVTPAGHVQQSAIDTKQIVTVAYNATRAKFEILSPLNLIAFAAAPSANQSGIATGTWTTVLYQTESYDRGNCYAAGVTSTFTAPVTGIYTLSATVSTTTAITDGTTAGVRFLKNGSTVIGGVRESLGGTHTLVMNPTWEGQLTAGDTVVVQFIHSHGSNVTLDYDGSTAIIPMSFSGRRIG